MAIPDGSGQSGSMEDFLSSVPIMPNVSNVPDTSGPAPANPTLGESIVSSAAAFNYGVEHNPINIMAAEVGTKLLGPAITTFQHLGLPQDSLQGDLINNNWDALAAPLLRKVGLDNTQRAAGFDPLTYNEGTKYEDYPQLFVGLNTPAEVQAKRQLLDGLELNSKDAIAHPYIAWAASQAADPLNYAQAGLAVATGGISAGGFWPNTVATSMAAAGLFGSQAALETHLMRSYDPSYQNSDVLTNAVTGAIMGAVLGGLAGAAASRSSMSLRGVKPNIAPKDIPTEVNAMDGVSKTWAQPEGEPSIPTTPQEAGVKASRIVETPTNVKWDEAKSVTDNLQNMGLRPFGKDTLPGDINRDMIPTRDTSEFYVKSPLEQEAPSFAVLHAPPEEMLQRLHSEIKTLVDGSAPQLDSVKMKIDPDGKVSFNPADIGC